MGTLRCFLKTRRTLAAWLLAAALLVKALVPAGYMPVMAHGAVMLQLCSGHGVETMAMPGMAGMATPGNGHDHGKPDGSGNDDTSCGFSGHAPAAMATVDPVLLVAAVLLIFATVFRRPLLPSVRRSSFLRPFLRGPPAIV